MFYFGAIMNSDHMDMLNHIDIQTHRLQHIHTHRDAHTDKCTCTEINLDRDPHTRIYTCTCRHPYTHIQTDAQR